MMNVNVERVWHFPANAADDNVRALSQTLQLPRSLALHLIKAGLSDIDKATAFLRPKLQELSNPFLLPNLAEAVDRIFKAIDRKERIVLYGDYDVDGVSSIALLTRV